MQHRLQRTGLTPHGFAVDEVKIVADSVQVRLRSRAPSGIYPDCGRPSRRVQSRYIRRPADLPLSGRRVELTIAARRFWCDAVLRGWHIFCEQFDKDVLARYGRRTQRLERSSITLVWRSAAELPRRLPTF
ncbi:MULTISPECIES: transposase family protein [Alphaproteobacteria]|uniref:transposase family protein n=1 Tax=Alphaproteobacteria TaxID=28211 RepID=UPI0024E08601|nr:transposase family protein [Ciceribacter naphthalenivorans]